LRRRVWQWAGNEWSKIVERYAQIDDDRHIFRESRCDIRQACHCVSRVQCSRVPDWPLSGRL
jgi:hypothetical protein